MIKLFIRLFLFVFICVSQSHAEIGVLQKTASGLAPISYGDEEGSEIFSDIIQKYQWPMISMYFPFLNPNEQAEYVKSLKNKHGVLQFIQQKLDQRFPNKYKAVFIPTTLFEMSAIICFMDWANNWPVKWEGDKRVTMVPETSLLHPTFNFSVEIDDRLFKSMEDVNINTQNQNFSILRNTFEKYNTDVGIRQLYFRTIEYMHKSKLLDINDVSKCVDILISEYEKREKLYNRIHGYKNFLKMDDQGGDYLGRHFEETLKSAVSEDIKAAENNEFLLFRGTKGWTYYQKGSQKKTLIDSPYLESAHDTQKAHDKSNRINTIVQSYWQSTSSGPLLYLPPEFKIDNDPKKKDTGKYSLYSLSFGNSILSGTFREAGNEGARPLDYIDKKYGYVLAFPIIDFLMHKDGQSSLSLNDKYFISPLCTLSSLFAVGEIFHSRSKISYLHPKRAWDGYIEGFGAEEKIILEDAFRNYGIFTSLKYDWLTLAQGITQDIAGFSKWIKSPPRDWLADQHAFLLFDPKEVNSLSEHFEKMQMILNPSKSQSPLMGSEDNEPIIHDVEIISEFSKLSIDAQSSKQYNNGYRLIKTFNRTGEVFDSKRGYIIGKECLSILDPVSDHYKVPFGFGMLDQQFIQYATSQKIDFKIYKSNNGQLYQFFAFPLPIYDTNNIKKHIGFIIFQKDSKKYTPLKNNDINLLPNDIKNGFGVFINSVINRMPKIERDSIQSYSIVENWGKNAHQTPANIFKLEFIASQKPLDQKTNYWGISIKADKNNPELHQNCKDSPAENFIIASDIYIKQKVDRELKMKLQEIKDSYNESMVKYNKLIKLNDQHVNLNPLQKKVSMARDTYLYPIFSLQEKITDELTLLEKYSSHNSLISLADYRTVYSTYNRLNKEFYNWSTLIAVALKWKTVSGYKLSEYIEQSERFPHTYGFISVTDTEDMISTFLKTDLEKLENEKCEALRKWIENINRLSRSNIKLYIYSHEQYDLLISVLEKLKKYYNYLIKIEREKIGDPKEQEAFDYQINDEFPGGVEASFALPDAKIITKGKSQCAFKDDNSCLKTFLRNEMSTVADPSLVPLMFTEIILDVDNKNKKTNVNILGYDSILNLLS